MRVGVLTGGGDCPGLNAVIRAVVRKGVKEHGFEFVGYRNGWRGPLEGLTMPLGIEECRGILPRGGTILGSSRTNPFKLDHGVQQITDNLARDGVDALVAIGGEDTLGVATKLAELGVDVVGVPKTIDNDLTVNDHTPGYPSAAKFVATMDFPTPPFPELTARTRVFSPRMPAFGVGAGTTPGPRPAPRAGTEEAGGPEDAGPVPAADCGSVTFIFTAPMSSSASTAPRASRTSPPGSSA